MDYHRRGCRYHPGTVSTRATFFALLVLVALGGCPRRADPETAAKRERASRAKQATGQAPPEIVAAPASGPVDELVRAELERAASDERRLLVYVGASWCEPCRAFHDAIEDGSLDGAYPNLRLLEFDLDRDRERLAAAGYASRLIPLLVLPEADGRGGPRRIEGGSKGPGAVDNIRGRLDQLLGRP